MTDDWDSLLANDEPATFPLVPDETVERPEAHIKPVKFTKTPLFLWGVVASGSVGFILAIYAITTYVSGTRKAVAIAPPPDPNAFVSPKQQEDDFFPKAPEGAPVAPVAVTPKAKPRTFKADALRRPASRAMYQNRVAYVDRPAPRVVRLPSQQTSFAPSAPRPQPARTFKPAPLPEPIGALYAPESGEGPQIEDAAPVAPIASAPVVNQGANPSIDNALAIYDGTNQSAPVVAADSPEPVESAPSLPQMSPVKVAEVSDSIPDPLTSQEFEKKFPQKAAQENLIARLAIPAETTIKGNIVEGFSWNAQQSFPIGKEIKIRVRSNFEQDGKVVIPKGSVAIAQSQEGGVGQYILANVTRIETPTGQSYSIQPGMLTASNADGFISADLKQPGQGGGVGRAFSKFGRSVLNLGVASIAPEGDSFGDRIARNAIYSGLDSVNDGLDGDRRGSVRGQVPSLYVIKPKTSIQLVANGDIQLEEGQQ